MPERAKGGKITGRAGGSQPQAVERLACGCVDRRPVRRCSATVDRPCPGSGRRPIPVRNPLWITLVTIAGER